MIPIFEKGSSPHTRGAQSPPSPRTCSRGIIPAYAGSTSTPSGPAPPAQDHPRIRGEHSPVDASYSKHEGSSPHTRGALDEARFHHIVGGIIPAYAGSTCSGSSPGRSSTDHPRIRGEHAVDVGPNRRRRGSSPHTRGARLRGARRHQERRIIPAYAGSTISGHATL